MNQLVAIALKIKAEEACKYFSDPTREYNSNKETFSVKEIVPLGDELAVAILDKSSGKRALLVFVYVKNYWTYFFPKAGHFLGWNKVIDYYLEVEKQNFSKNFVEEKPLQLADMI